MSEAERFSSPSCSKKLVLKLRRMSTIKVRSMRESIVLTKGVLSESGSNAIEIGIAIAW